MKSKWEMKCEKVSAGIVIKKFERLMAVQLLDIKVERILFQGHRFEMLYCVIDFPDVHEWDSLVLAQLKFCEKFSNGWHMDLLDKKISGRWEFGGIGGNPTIAGVVEAAWAISADQVYSSWTWLGDKPDMW